MEFESSESEFALSIVRRLRDAGCEALWAGGCVRDLLLNNAPSDYDIATSATPKQVRKLFGYENTAAVGLVFGVVIVREPHSRHQIEVATFRTESSYSDGRRPDSVEFSTPEKDAQRRDFTINGMFFDPIAERVIDFVEGQEDLRLKRIRAIGDAEERIAEDKLRMLRAVRFAARFGFDIESSTREAIAKNSEAVSIISGERIAVEFQKTLSTARAGWAVKEWEELSLLKEILPWPKAASYSDPKTQELIENASQALDRMQACGWRAKASCLLLKLELASKDLVAGTVQALKSRLKLANDDAKAIKFSLGNLESLQQAESLPWSQLQPLLISPWIRDAQELLQASDDWSSAREHIEEKLQLAPELLDPKPLITGNDLIEQGIKPGPQIKQLLDQVRKMQLDGELASQQAALEFAHTRIKGSR